MILRAEAIRAAWTIQRPRWPSPTTATLDPASTFATFSTGIQLTTPLSLAATGAVASVAGPVAILTIAGVGLMAVGAISFVGSLRVGPAIRSAASA